MTYEDALKEKNELMQDRQELIDELARLDAESASVFFEIDKLHLVRPIPYGPINILRTRHRTLSANKSLIQRDLTAIKTKIREINSTFVTTSADRIHISAPFNNGTMLRMLSIARKALDGNEEAVRQAREGFARMDETRPGWEGR